MNKDRITFANLREHWCDTHERMFIVNCPLCPLSRAQLLDKKKGEERLKQMMCSGTIN